MIRLVVFDMDDTLFPEYEFVRSGFEAVADYMEEQFGIEDFFDTAWNKFIEGERGRIFDQIIDDEGLETDSRTIGKVLEIYRSHYPKISLFKDAQWALEYCSAFVPLALISDGYLKTQENKAEALNIERFFQKVYFTDKWGPECWKPSTCAFEMAEKDFSVLGSECVYVSDNPIKDFIGPNKLGWKSIYIERKEGVYSGVKTPHGGEPEVKISSLYDLKQALSMRA